MTDTPPPAQAPDRRVYYFHGFDPASVERYRRIFADASSRLGVAVQDPVAGEGWRAVRDGVVTDIVHMRYEDLVRTWQSGAIWTRVFRGIRALAGYATDGALTRMARLGPRNLILALSPVIVIALFGLIGVFHPATDALVWDIVALLFAMALLTVALPALFLDLVFDLFAYMRALARGTDPASQAFGDRTAELARNVTPDASDTLIVGHSLGGVTAIHTLAATLDHWPSDRPIGLLTLGSTHGTVLVQRGAGRDRLAAAIERIASDDRVFWVDVSSPRDAFCLPLLDPLCLIDAQPGMKSPRVVSARLARAPRIPGDRRTTFAAMRRHMGYLLAPVDGSGFDFADTITGTQDLSARFGPRKNSPKARMWQG